MKQTMEQRIGMELQNEAMRALKKAGVDKVLVENVYQHLLFHISMALWNERLRAIDIVRGGADREDGSTDVKEWDGQDLCNAILTREGGYRG